jgi:quercetin dioxygenase-like cupin family protein
MHFHGIKHETFYILKGQFRFRYINPHDAEILERTLAVGDVVSIPPLSCHQLECLEEGATIVEFASADYSWDNYRVTKGDSQKVSVT